MAYCTQQNMIDNFSERELIQLTDRHDVNAIDTDVLSRAMERGTSVIDSHCRDRYVLPLNPVDEMIVSINCDLARYYLYDNDADDAVTKRHDEAMEVLGKISLGRMRLSAALVTSGGSVGGVQFDSGDAVFSRDKTRGF